MSSIPGELWRKSWNRWHWRTGFCFVQFPKICCPLPLRMAGAFLLCVVSAVSVAIRNNKTLQYMHNILLRWLGHLNKVLCVDFIVTYLQERCWIGNYVTCAVGIARLMGRYWQRFSERLPKPASHIVRRSLGHLPKMFSSFLQKTTCFLQFSCEVMYRGLSWHVASTKFFLVPSL